MRASTFSLLVIVKLVLAWLGCFGPCQVDGLPIADGEVVRQQEVNSVYGLLNWHKHKDIATAAKYAPPSTCREPCATLLAILDTCEDDSCVCSQKGFNAFFQ